jgi:hypothetical protein
MLDQDPNNFINANICTKKVEARGNLRYVDFAQSSEAEKSES